MAFSSAGIRLGLTVFTANIIKALLYFSTLQSDLDGWLAWLMAGMSPENNKYPHPAVCMMDQRSMDGLIACASIAIWYLLVGLDSSIRNAIFASRFAFIHQKNITHQTHPRLDISETPPSSPRRGIRRPHAVLSLLPILYTNRQHKLFVQP